MQSIPTTSPTPPLSTEPTTQPTPIIQPTTTATSLPSIAVTLNTVRFDDNKEILKKPKRNREQDKFERIKTDEIEDVELDGLLLLCLLLLWLWLWLWLFDMPSFELCIFLTFLLNI